MTPNEKLKKSDPPIPMKFSHWSFAHKINLFTTRTRLDMLGLIDPCNLEKSSKAAIEYVENEMFEEIGGVKLKYPLRNQFLLSDKMVEVICRALAHYGHNPSNKIMKRFGFGPINNIKKQVEEF